MRVLDLGLTDKVALVTGGTGALGHEIIKALLDNGVKVVTVYRTVDKLQELNDYVGTLQDQLTGLEGDVTDEGSVASIVQETLEKFGRVDILLNIAGGYRGGNTIAETKLEEFNIMMELNLKSAFLCCRAVLPPMIRQNYGKIISISARPAVDIRRRIKSGAYAISKTAVKTLTETVAEEVKDYKINVNCIMPSTMKTEENLKNFPNADSSKWVDPYDVAKVILFLVSDASQVTSGSAVPVFGKS
jgi:NAD(P)-dependent dehydrogenase (short-subunit alcohol dehydrogenase family)